MEKHRVEQATEVLIKAYFTNNLQHESCTRCAVGNLVLHGTRELRPIDQQIVISGWYMDLWGYYMKDCPDKDTYVSKYTQYSSKQIIEIEVAFENRVTEFGCCFNRYEDIFVGLNRVFDKLVEFDRDYFEKRAFEISQNKLTLEPFEV